MRLILALCGLLISGCSQNATKQWNGMPYDESIADDGCQTIVSLGGRLLTKCSEEDESP